MTANHVKEFRPWSRTRTNSITIHRDMPGDRAGGMQLRKGELAAPDVCLHMCACTHAVLLSPFLSAYLSDSLPPSPFFLLSPSLYACQRFGCVKSTILNQSVFGLLRNCLVFVVVVGKKSPVYGKWKDFYFHLKYEDQKLLYYDDKLR